MRYSPTLIDAINWWALNRADVPALVMDQDSVSYAELARWGETIAIWLRESGLKSGDRVAMLASNTVESCMLCQGVLRAGGIMVPINQRFTAPEVSYMLDRYQPAVVFHDTDRTDLAKKAGDASNTQPKLHNVAHIKTLREQANDVQSFGRRPDINAESLAVIISTSGSTGRPKGVMHDHRNITNYLSEMSLSEPASYDPSRMILFAPLCVASGYIVMMQHLGGGATVFIFDGFDAQKALLCIVENKITELTAAPIFLERIADLEEFADADVSSVSLCTVGGARVSDTLLTAWHEKGVLIRQLYGQTEACGQATVNSREEALTHPEKCGRGMPFTRIAIKAPSGDFCPPHTQGEIVVQGPSVMVGYWKDPEATAKTLKDGWLHTGDLGVVDETGSLTFVDRLKDIIISGGLNISAAEVERVITTFPGVLEVAVIAAIDQKFGETPLAVIYADTSVDVTSLIAYCNTELSDYKVPRYVALQDRPLPRLSGGKISKVALRELYANAHLELPRVR